ncbi:hypothetical protein PUR29_36890 [Methylobacterium ajmalii]|uniref:Uncharacterized protein n=1 Tax=Methylobacterium ajmalii TaxID=2738439 RepID=A0ABV0A5B0_9HYPH
MTVETIDKRIAPWMTTVTIPLTRPVDGHRGEIREVILREPTWGDVMPVGNPYTIHHSPEGVPIVVENPAIIEHYLERCVVEPMHYNLLTNCNLRDALRVRQALLDFFLNAEPGDAASNTSPGTSSSSSASHPTPSGA